jgi:hypothetical protein
VIVDAIKIDSSRWVYQLSCDRAQSAVWLYCPFLLCAIGRCDFFGIVSGKKILFRSRADQIRPAKKRRSAGMRMMKFRDSETAKIGRRKKKKRNSLARESVIRGGTFFR